MVNDIMGDGKKRELLTQRTQTLLLCLKQQLLGLTQPNDIRHEQVQDVGKSILETYSRVLESSEIYGKMQAVFIEMDATPTRSVTKELKNLKDAVMKGEEGSTDGEFDPEKHIDAYLPVRVNEQRVSHLLLSSCGGVIICNAHIMLRL